MNTKTILATVAIFFSGTTCAQITAEWTNAPSGLAWIRHQGLIVGGIAYKEFLVTSGTGEIEVTATLDVTGHSISTSMPVVEGGTYRAELVLDLDGNRSASNGEACFTATWDSQAFNAAGSHSLFAIFQGGGSYTCPNSITIAPQSMDVASVSIQSGDTQGLVGAINTGNAFPGLTMISLNPGGIGGAEFQFMTPADGSQNALPDITGNIAISGLGNSPITLTTAGDQAGEFRLVKVDGIGSLHVSNLNVDGFGERNFDGGAIQVTNMGVFRSTDANFRNNFAGRNGGVIAALDRAEIEIVRSGFMDNRASRLGGGVYAEGNSRLNVHLSRFSGNTVGVFGCDVVVNSDTGPEDHALTAKGNIFDGDCGGSGLIENGLGNMFLANNTINAPSNGVHSFTRVGMFANVFNLEQAGGSPLTDGIPPAKPEALCIDSGSNAYESLGYNISTDNSCALNQATDLPDTSPMTGRDADDLVVLQPGSPAIDSGPVEAVVLDGDNFASLPCSYRDLAGTGRPQDANGDGMFECDRGAMEVRGGGQIGNGHSGSFYNSLRDGEGNFVEILNDSLAIVYTFTFRPDGSGPAWFLGVGDINENSIVVDDLVRPVGTSFGDGFDMNDVQFTPAGSMSLVFPDCAAADPGGNVAYTGDRVLGYEGLISRATRITEIVGCGAPAPDPRAGLSGSWYDPGRDGEGIVVEWLSNGLVLVIFYTYDQHDNQLWLLGVGTPDGNMVTLDALYPATFTPWGRGFDADDLTLLNWGTFTLTWTECNAVTFAYDSTVPGFGSATRSYIRLSSLSGTSCPDF